MLSAQPQAFRRHRQTPPHSPPYFSRSTLAVALLLLVGALSAGPVLANEVVRSEPMRAHEGYFREHCTQLQSGQTLDFRVVTPHPVDFNIHHHTDSDTTYPVRQPVQRELATSLAITDSGEYCFMWRNSGDYPADYSIDLTYQAR